MRIPFDAMVYEKAADEDHFIDEFTVIREMAVHIGRVIMLCFVIIISPFVSIQWIFILGAIAALSFNFLRMEKSAT